MTTFGYGQQGPRDSADEYSRLIFAIRQWVLGNVCTMKVCQVVAVRGGGLTQLCFVDVQPMVNQVDGLGNATAHGTVPNLPVLRMQAGANAVILDPVVGDIGIVIVSDRDISAVKSNSKVSNPGSFRRFNLADGVYIGGVFNKQTIEQYVQFTGTGLLLADKNGNQLQSSSAGWKFTGNVEFDEPVVMKSTMEVDGAAVLKGAAEIDGATTFKGTISQIGGGATVLSGSLAAASAAITGVMVSATARVTGDTTSALQVGTGAGAVIIVGGGEVQAQGNVIAFLGALGGGNTLHGHVHTSAAPGVNTTPPIAGT